jgi:PAS domain S-box-containing protein
MAAKEVELASREAILAETESIAQIGHWRWDLGTDGMTTSAELRRICGIGSSGGMTFTRLEKHIHADDRARIRHEVIRCVRGERVAFELRFVRPDGVTRVLSMRSRPLIVDGQATVLTGTGQDVTEKRELESRITIADRLTSLGTIAGGVAHEVNNPLTSVLANVGLVLDDLAAPPGPHDAARRTEWVEALTDARDGAERVRQIIADLRTFSRGEREEEGVGEVDAALSLAIKLTRHEIGERARLVTDFAAVPAVRGSDSRLAQVFVNLLVNAAQAIPPGQPEENAIRVTTGMDADGRVVVSISDTGAGMTDEIRARIFDPFFTTKPIGQGTGLGLSICHGIVSSVGGTIEVETAELAGTTFRVHLQPAATVAKGTDPHIVRTESWKSPGGATLSTTRK